MSAVKTKATPLATVRPPAQDLDVARLVLEGDKGTRIVLNPLITAITLEATMDGASTVTIVVHDHTRRLLRSTIVKTASSLVLDRAMYRLVKVARDGNQLTLTFEDAAVNVLRRYDKPRKANRENTTRAQFVQVMVKEPTEYLIPFQCPEVKVRQPIAST